MYEKSEESWPGRYKIKYRGKGNVKKNKDTIKVKNITKWNDCQLWKRTEFSVQFSCSVVSDSLRHHGLQHARLPCPSTTPVAYSNLTPSCWWCHPTISSSVIPFSSRLQSFPASDSFPMSWFFASGDQSSGVSALASVLPMNTPDWSPLGWTGWISPTRTPRES